MWGCEVVGWVTGIAGPDRWSAGVGTAVSLCASENNDGKRLNDYMQIINQN